MTQTSLATLMVWRKLVLSQHTSSFPLPWVFVPLLTRWNEVWWAFQRKRWWSLGNRFLFLRSCWSCPQVLVSQPRFPQRVKMPRRKSSLKLKRIVWRYARALENLDNNWELLASSPPRRRNVRHSRSVPVIPKSQVDGNASLPFDDDRTVKTGNLARNKEIEHDKNPVCALSLPAKESAEIVSDSKSTATAVQNFNTQIDLEERVSEGVVVWVEKPIAHDKENVLIQRMEHDLSVAY